LIKTRPQSPEVAAEEFAIVLIGDFNPKIYQPSWFAIQKLIRQSEAESAVVELIHSDFTSFSTEWFVLQVARERFSVTVKSSAFKRQLHDLVLGTFNLLSHTPIRQMGINATTRLRFRSQADWHAFGHFLVPKSQWAKILRTPGTRTVTVQGIRDDGRPGHVAVAAEPVQRTLSESIIRVNDHYDGADGAAESECTAYLLEVLAECYHPSLNRAKEIADTLVHTYLQQDTFDDGSAND
jgi:hypothetical protein